MLKSSAPMASKKCNSYPRAAPKAEAGGCPTDTTLNSTKERRRRDTALEMRKKGTTTSATSVNTERKI
ncbi:hypothetical protein KM043_008092 [Ampulex compressa]|nr:hypothetical protein KM043_008092 [Ampulex compressa]